VFFTRNPTKLRFHFFVFSTIFSGSYKIQPKARSLEVFADSQLCPCFTLKTLERSKSLQLGPRAKGVVRLAGIRRGRAGVRPGIWRKGSRSSPGVADGRSWGRKRQRRAWWWSRTKTTAGAPIPAKERRVPINARGCKIE
jgi:hypothetical protein